MVTTPATKKMEKQPEVCTVQLSLISSELDPFSSSCSPVQTVFVQIAPHGDVVVLYRFTSGEIAQSFELSSAEVEALVAANLKRRVMEKRYLASQSQPFGDDDYPY